MIKTKCIFAPTSDEDGERILISRGYPYHSDAHLDIWFVSLGPSKDLLDAWKADSITWEEYTDRYHEEMKSRTGLIAKLAERSKKGTITLLCFEKEDNPHCHRHLLKRLIEAVQDEESFKRVLEVTEAALKEKENGTDSC